LSGRSIDAWRGSWSLSSADRYSRQVRFAPIGEAGQRRLSGSSVGVAGMGALGTVVSDQLVRAGVGRVRIIDRDFVETSNLQRQTLFDEADALASLPKAVAAERKLRQINSGVSIESTVDDLNPSNVEAWIDGLDLILDGLDNFETRFVLNDACRAAGVGWIYGAVVGSYGLTLPILPRGPCLRCVLEELPPPGSAPTCDVQGVIAPATSVVGSLEVAQAMRFLTGQLDTRDIRLTTVDVWTLKFRTIRLETRPDCPLCVGGKSDYLVSGPLETVTLCGRNAVQLIPRFRRELDLVQMEGRLRVFGPVQANEFLVKCSNPPYEMTLFRDGRAIVKGTEESSVARSVYAKMVGV
jgi:molybdopterin/thiamine biosynthesis adenylyltransferase